MQLIENCNFELQNLQTYQVTGDEGNRSESPDSNNHQTTSKYNKGGFYIDDQNNGYQNYTAKSTKKRAENKSNSHGPSDFERSHNRSRNQHTNSSPSISNSPERPLKWTKSKDDTKASKSNALYENTSFSNARLI